MEHSFNLNPYKHTMKRFAIGFVALAFAIVCVGCSGDKRVKVSGKVTVGGKAPLTGGNIQFVSVADPNKIGGGQIKADGTYEVVDAPLGECKVVIDNTHLDPASRKAGMMPMAPPKMGMGMGKPGGMGNPKPPADTKKMGDAPKGVEVSSGMGDSDITEQKYVKIDAAYTKAESTTLKQTVSKAGETFDFDVK